MIKIMIADDQQLIRDSLKIILEANKDFSVTDTVANGQEVLESIKKKKPDIILMDVRMPVMDGTVCTKYVKEKYPSIKVIILTTFDDDDFIFSALKYGASGYLLKGASTKELYNAIKTVYQGGAMINPDITEKVFRLFSKMAQANYAIQVNDKDTQNFSQHEWLVIQQVGFGLSNKEIAAKLFLSEGTVRNYISKILDKLQLRDRTQLAIWAVQTGVTSENIKDDNETQK
ncbi:MULTISPECIES: response regulator transcription factor [Lactobacillus]|uniref:response regulator transcription factor n=1 Tax=Lactobacillus TaxID=1578 RepID=UPI000EFBC128|nr:MULTISPECIES: response regulator transcription factor [Lactobacillus]MBC6349405.1 response regulator transcription factor [Lactobacillus melliventris]MBH9988851.1 response regulator transcription factor [Lactobacillus sp. M0392]MBI0023530.1 response regulator transcription factor [Lactobacillus sp. W8171]MBI0043935.1 response regulator transcription factor [Lactobacillus sp. M0393]RMC60077.1 DNA-binding response regulator [Lactobacillus sp. ESL0260]